MPTPTPNNIQAKYGELLRLLSLMGDRVEVIVNSPHHLTFHIFQDNKPFLSFRLEQAFTEDPPLDISWKVLNSVGYISSCCFPSFMSQESIFNTIVSKIANWQQQIITSNLKESLSEALHRKENIRKVFIRNWSLLNFQREFGPRMVIMESTNKTTGKKFPNTMFINDRGISTYVGFYSKLGPLTEEEIISRKNELYVGLTPNGKYYLHNNNVVEYEEVDLNI